MDFSMIISAFAALSGMILGWLAKAKTIRERIENEASTTTKIKSDVDYIKHGIDEMRLEQKDQGRRFDALAERVTRVEESSRSAHKRIDRLEGVRR